MRKSLGYKIKYDPNNKNIRRYLVNNKWVHRRHIPEIKEKLKKEDKEWRLKNIERIKEYNSKNIERIKEYNKEYYFKNKEHLNEYQKEYSLKYPERKKEQQRKTYYKNIEQRKEYNSKNKEYRNEYERNKKKTDPNFRLRCNLSTRIWQVLKGKSKSASTMELIGCTIEELWVHLESSPKWELWMTRENYGRSGGWDIDHIKACANFDLTDPKQQQRCCNWSNLQPMEHIENIKKRDKIILGDITSPKM